MNAVVLLGDLNMDVNIEISQMPAPGGDGIADSQEMGMGGSAANTAVSLVRLGTPASLVCCIGRDALGVSAVSQLASTGVDAAYVQRSDVEGTSLNIVAVTPDGERTMIAYRGASALLQPDDLPVRLIEQAAFVHASGYAALADPQYSAIVHGLRIAREADVPSSLDVPVDPPRLFPDRIRELIGLVEVLVIGRPETAALDIEGETEEVLAGLLALGPRYVALKLGSKGAILAHGAERWQAAAPAVKVVDTTGAGDAFCAGLIHGWVTGRGPQEALRLAVHCGSAAVTRRGAGVHMPGADDLTELHPADWPTTPTRIGTVHSR